MTPTQKATKVFKAGKYDAKLVLQALAAKAPQLFLEAVAQYPQASEEVNGVIKLSPSDQYAMMVMVREGEIVPAIKHVRAITGAGLRDSKDYVDSYRGQRPIQPPIARLETAEENLVKSLLQRAAPGDKLRAIKHIRQLTGLGLKEAVIMVDTIKANL